MVSPIVDEIFTDSRIVQTTWFNKEFFRVKQIVDQIVPTIRHEFTEYVKRFFTNHLRGPFLGICQSHLEKIDLTLNYNEEWITIILGSSLKRISASFFSNLLFKFFVAWKICLHRRTREISIRTEFLDLEFQIPWKFLFFFHRKIAEDWYLWNNFISMRNILSLYLIDKLRVSNQTRRLK